MMSRYIVLVWTLLLLCQVDGTVGGSTNHAFFGPYNFVNSGNPVSRFEIQGAREVNKFTSGGLYQTKINENAGIGTHVRSAVKMGLYVAENGEKIEYFVSNSATLQQSSVNCSWTSTFRLVGELIENFYFLRLKTTRMLSQESCKSYLFTVNAQYSANKRIIDTTKVLIEVKLSRNMPLSFTDTNPKAKIPSDFPLFQPIMQLDTADKDKHNIGKVYFQLKRQSKYFALNPDNGVLFLKRPLPVDSTQHDLVAYVRRWDSRLIRIVLQDHSCKITVKVSPANQYAPLISVIVVDNVENKARTIAATIFVNDRDQGRNGKIDSLAIISGDEDRRFRLEKVNTDNKVFRLRLVKPILNSKFSRPSLTFIATDKGNPPKRSTTLYRVNLVDLASTRIRFPKENYLVNVSEMVPTNYTVIQINALNLKPSSTFSYLIVQGDSSNHFRIESNTGKIIVAGALDAELTSVYKLKVALNVTGEITLTTNVHIQVEDFNDHVPKFTSDNYFVEIHEDMALNTSIYKVVAKDGDSGDNGLVSYWLPNSDRFAIHPYTGVIFVNHVSDRDSNIPEYAYLVVRAGDSGSPIRRITETVVKVKINAWNDNAPIVKQHTCKISLSPSTPVGTKLVQVQAIDIDVDTIEQPSFSLIMGNTGSYFAIDSISGDVTIAKPLGDAHSSYSLIVSATDGTFKSINEAVLQIEIDMKITSKNVSCTDSSTYIKALKRKSEHQVTAVANKPVIDRNPPQNIHMPRFIQRELKVTIPVSEDLEIGSVLTTVKATDNDNGYEGMVNYYIVGGNINQCFDVDIETGELKSIAKLDRERVPKYKLNISAWDMGISRKADFITVVVVVKDVNDNAPVFEQELYNISVSENAPVGRTVLKLLAKDNDEGVNQRVTYQLMDDYDKLFFIDYNSGDLIINNLLDFEVEKFYALKVLALDGAATNQLIGQAEVIINVLDENDHSPVINPVMQDIYIMKDFPVQSPITQVAASDPDSGIGGKVSFALAKGHGSDLFSITDKTGLLTLKRSFTSSIDGFYNLTVVVSDQGQPSLTSHAQVNIHIIQRISDEDVQIMSNQGGIIKYSVPENSPPGYQIGQLTNSERQNSFLFSIIDGTDVTKFDLIDTSGLLTNKEALDREDIPYYWLTIQVLTRQSRQFHNNIQLLIKVDDKNDNHPIFSHPVYDSKIPENTSAEEIVVNVSASDRDAGENARLVYSVITGNSEGHFKINSKTGLITTTNIPLDYEQKKIYQLVVKVTDNGSTPRSSEASLTIQIQDENDNRPKYKDNLNIDFIISGTTQISKDTLLGQVLACDKDQGENGDLTFKILSGDQGGKIRIDPKSGQLFSNDILHSDDAFQLQVKVKDGGNPSLYDTTGIDLVVSERFISGHSPPTFPNKYVNISLPESTPVGHKIGVMPATDKDNDDLPVYFIKSGNEDQRFQLDSTGTSVELIAELDVAKDYHVVISATDGKYSSDFTLNIKVKDTNDHYPVPEMIERIVTVPENVLPGTKVVTVKASDLDTSAINAQIRFSFKSAVISKSLKLFDIDVNTGEITVKGALDYEDMRSHVLIVAMTDTGYQPKQSTMYVVINVADVNEWKPQFVKSSYHITIPENIPRGSDVIKVLAKDKDQGLDAVLKYSITSGNYGYAFTIKPQSGVIQTSRELKASHISLYTLTVEVRDDGVHGLSATTNVTVSLLTSGNRPGFAKNAFSISMYENQPISTVVESVGFDGLMTFYTFTNKAACANDFQINPFTGVITSKKIFDAEKASSCSIQVKAEDGDGYSQESTVNIEIKDLNDNAPQMEEQTFIGYIEENALENTLVLNAEGQPLVIAALDMDIEPNNRNFKYNIINTMMDSYFKLDENTGALLTSKLNLDYEMAQSYTFLVKVSDGGLPSLSDVATVVVHVKNINDVAPEFSKGVVEVLMYLPTYNGVHVTTLTASDGDNFGNITFSIKQQDTSVLTVNPTSGALTIDDATKARKDWYDAVVEVNDGKMTGSAKVRVLFKPFPITELEFPRSSFVRHIRENTSLVQTVFTPFVRGYKIRERIRFSLGNLQDKFTIKESTGAIKTKSGVVIDREKISSFQLLLLAQDERTPPRMAHSIVNVIVDDVNDCRPTFPPPPIFFVVPKSSKIGYTIATITALDCDEAKNGEIRYEIKSDKSKIFGIDAQTGALKVLGSLVGVRTPEEFSLIIEASDLGKKPLRSEAAVSVKIESGDACIFQKPSYNVELSEDATVDKVFKRLHARCPGGRPLFNIISGDTFDQFVCDLNTGELSLASKLDFEATVEHKLTVRAKDSNTGASSNAVVNILVKDVNDNPPTFEGTPYFVRVSERTPVGKGVMRVVTADLDSGENKKRFYEIVGDTSVFSGTFAIVRNTGVLSVAKRLDYETKKRFDVTVRVTDRGRPSLSSETIIKVFVIDVNDNAPIFRKSQYSATVLDNAGPNHFVTQVLATDEDETDFEKLKYSIASGPGRSFFRIDAKSGVVSLSQIPGLVLGKVYSLKLSVSDGNFTSYTKLDVVIGQTNNHPPVFQMDVFHAQVTENYPADTYVAMVTATDRDSGAFGEVVYAIDSEKAAKDFKVDKVSGILTTRKPLDREVMSFATVLIRATDNGGKSTFCNVKVDILDENDNQPKFQMPSYAAVVSITRASPGENVVKVTAIDLDAGENSDLTYSLVGQISPFVFGVNSSSGDITFLRKPRESTYNFYVRVSDNGRLKLRSYAQVRVFVTSLAFKFKHRTYLLSISEDVRGSIHQKLDLLDTNGALVTSNVDYSIEVGATPKTNQLGTFSINSNGELQIYKSLDYETVSNYDLTVRANRSSFSAYTTVHIHILDTNDNSPEFESNFYVANIPENSLKGTRVVQVQAHDKDSGKNGLVTYEMSAESKRYLTVFTVDEKTGWITSKGDLDRETLSSYTLQVSAKDHGTDKQFVSTTRVDINLDDVNDSPPVFSNPMYVTSITEDSPIGTEVLSLNTTDKDVMSSIVYYIVDGDSHNHFNIDQNSGKIYVHAKLDHELLPGYLLRITASDGAFIASCSVKIEIIDVNDNKPLCKKLRLRAPLPENTTVGTSIVVINATDKDKGNNSRITFAIFNYHEKFSIDSITGTIKLDHRLDREKKSSYNFLVSASDGNGACYTNVTIDVTDINDCPPEFTKPRYTKPVPIDSEKNAILLRVEATDKDVGLNRKVTYSFLNATTAHVFSIEKETGIISLQSGLIWRDEEKFVFNVVATDSGIPALSSETTVEIVVSPIKNCSFVKDEYKSEIPEDTNVIYTFKTVSVTCSSDKFNIGYRLADGNNETNRLFAINEKKGILSLKAALDYEHATRHTFDVEAFMVKTSGKTILISSTSIKIKVIDCNDNRPEFKKDSYEATVNEGSSEGLVVVSVYATDNDTPNTVSYSIIKSVPEAAKFAINSASGIVTVQGTLDRETTERYELVVSAKDYGNPPLSSNVSVLININDVNDNRPVVKKEIKTLIHTNTVVGAVIVKLTPTDADGPSNSKPFKFSVLSGENNILNLDSSSGALTTKQRLVRHNTTYSMMIRTTDSGSPPLFADTSVEITVVKYSLNPPKVKPVTVYVNMLTDFDGGIIGKVVAHDPDKDDILRFSLLEGNAQFSIDLTDGAIRITSLLDQPSYFLVVQVTDGTHKVNTKVTVRAKVIAPNVVEKSVGIRITHKTLGDFVSLSLSPMIAALTDLMSCTVDEVYLWSIQTSPENKLDVVFAVKKHGKQEYFDPNYIRETLERQLTKFEKLSRVVVFSVGIFPCEERPCTRGQKCENKIKVVNTWSILSSDTTTFLSYKNNQESKCVCAEGESDLACTLPTYSKCLKNPCKSGLQCVDRHTGYECVCPRGKNCDKECHGDKCHEDAMTFNGNSYIRYSLTDKKEKLTSFSVSVKTTKPSGTILSAKGKNDYFIIEIVEGKIRVRFDYGSGEGIARIDQVKLNDGQWHDLKVTRLGKYVSLTLDSGRYMTESPAVGSMRLLDVQTDNVIVGGELPRRSRRSSNAVSNGYFGCMENPRLNDYDLPISGSNSMAKAATQGVTRNCSIAVCHPSFCQNDGQCKIIEKNGYKVPSCTCKPSFTGVDCGEDVNECDSLPCKNSGVCVNTIGSFKCNCIDSNFKGKLCETPAVLALSQTAPLGTKEFIYIGATVFVLIIIAIIIACACRCWHKQKKKAKARGAEHERHEMKIKGTDEEISSHPPPPPPPRRGDVDEQPKLGSRAPSWDYTELPEMGLNRKKLPDSKTSSFGNLTKSCEDLGECSGISIPQVPKRPSIPDVPKKPSQYRCSRASSQNSILDDKYAEASEFGEEGLDIIRQRTKDFEKLAYKTAGFVDAILGTNCASSPSECDTRSEYSEVNELLSVGHLETYDDNEVDYFIPENDQDAVSTNDSDDEASTMLEKLPDVRHSGGEVHKESQL